MHCPSCEVLLSERLSDLPGVTGVDVSYKKGEARLFSRDSSPDDALIAEAVESVGYTVGRSKPTTFFSRRLGDYRDLAIALGTFALLLALFRFSPLGDIGSMLPSVPSHLGIVFLIGLAAGVSTCLAVVGGLVLGVSARFAETHPNASFARRFRPHVFFHTGRFAAFLGGGALLGSVGSMVSFSPGITALLLFLAALVMMLLGLKLVGIFPGIERIHVTLPPALSRTLGIGPRRSSAYRDRDTLILGAASFLLPCGFTQAMQVFAAGSGTALSGALIMGVFALGTTPGLLGIGTVASLARGGIGTLFFRFSGVVVITFSLVTLVNAVRLFSLGNEGETRGTVPKSDASLSERTRSNTSREASLPGESGGVVLEDGVQIVRMRETGRGYIPGTLTVQRAIPVRWIITAEDPYSCAASLYAPQIGVEQILDPGENVIEFTPTERGTISFSCSMGMYAGKFIVTD